MKLLSFYPGPLHGNTYLAPHYKDEEGPLPVAVVPFDDNLLALSSHQDIPSALSTGREMVFIQVNFSDQCLLWGAAWRAFDWGTLYNHLQACSDDGKITGVSFDLANVAWTAKNFQIEA